MTVLALDPNRRTNGQLMADVAELGYILPEDSVLDVTYGKGRFWTKYVPDHLVRNDLYSAEAVFHCNWESLYPDWERQFNVVVFDPPYKLQGTSSNAGPASSNAAFGMDRAYVRPDALLASIGRGLVECVRVTYPGGYVMVKSMDQVVSGDKVWMPSRIERSMEESLHCRLIDRLYVFGYRQQPPGRRQVHSHGSFSTLSIFEVPR